MRKTKFSGSFVVCLLINLLLNLEWAIPGILLLVLHFWLGISVVYSIVAFSLWIIIMVVWMLIVGWATKCGDTPDPPKENKNPYSAHKN